MTGQRPPVGAVALLERVLWRHRSLPDAACRGAAPCSTGTSSTARTRTTTPTASGAPLRSAEAARSGSGALTASSGYRPIRRQETVDSSRPPVPSTGGTGDREPVPRAQVGGDPLPPPSHASSSSSVGPTTTTAFADRVTITAITRTTAAKATAISFWLGLGGLLVWSSLLGMVNAPSMVISVAWGQDDPLFPQRVVLRLVQYDRWCLVSTSNASSAVRQLGVFSPVQLRRVPLHECHASQAHQAHPARLAHQSHIGKRRPEHRRPGGWRNPPRACAREGTASPDQDHAPTPRPSAR